MGPPTAGRLTADHRRVPHLRVVVHVALGRPLRRLGVAVERQLSEHGHRNKRRRTCQEPASCKFSHA